MWFLFTRISDFEKLLSSCDLWPLANLTGFCTHQAGSTHEVWSSTKMYFLRSHVSKFSDFDFCWLQITFDFHRERIGFLHSIRGIPLQSTEVIQHKRFELPCLQAGVTYILTLTPSPSHRFLSPPQGINKCHHKPNQHLYCLWQSPLWIKSTSDGQEQCSSIWEIS